MRMTTVMNPHAKRSVVTAEFHINDFVQVPVLETYGVWSMKDLLPLESQAALARWANAEEERYRTHLRRKRHL